MDNIFKQLAASNHSNAEREKNDYYATEPKAVELLLDEEQFSHTVWECACGQGHLSKAIEKRGYNVISTDLVYRGYGSLKPLDFLKDTLEDFDGDIITNPPYKDALNFCKRAIAVLHNGHKAAMFLKIQFLEGKSRRKFFDEYPPKTVYVASARLNCARNGDFEKYPSNSAVCYAWFIWEKGYKGETVVKWIN